MTQVDTLEPLPVPEGPPERRLPPRRWVRENLFPSRLDALIRKEIAANIALVKAADLKFN